MDSKIPFSYDSASLLNFDMNIEDKSEPTKYDSFDVVDLEIFEAIKFQSEDDMSVIREVYLSYFSEAEVLVKRISGYFDKGNYDKLKQSIHSFSGISSTIGAVKLVKITKDVDKSLMQNDFENISECIPILLKSYKELKKTINQMI